MPASAITGSSDALQLADWRRRVGTLYEQVRQMQDPEDGWRLWRRGRDALFRDHSQSPLSPDAKATFRGLPLFPYDPAWRLVADIVPVDGADHVDVDLGGDGVLHLSACARTDGLSGVLGRELSIFWLAGYGGGLFLPFRDGTAASETYGGGRYLLDTIKGADLGLEQGRLILDFNFAYHPSCFYSPRWTCPLAPTDNHLETPIRAGERLRP